MEKISDEDKVCYSAGQDYDMYKKLGACLCKHKEVSGVRFAVWAPNAKAVSIVGDFNLWDEAIHRMALHEKSGVWTLFIPELSQECCYKYAITTQEGRLLYKVDPYASYYEVRPSTASKIWDENTYTWEDENWLENRKKRDWLRSPISIYEVHIGSWKKHQDERFYTYREVADELVKYVKYMGYTHVELMGVMEHPFDGSWGYQVTGFFAPTSRFGTPDDFKYLVDTMHQHHIGVILDWVPAHFPRDDFGLKAFDGTHLYEIPNEEYEEWQTLKFNYARDGVKNFLIGSVLSWIERYHIDGLRVDAVSAMIYRDRGMSSEAIAFIKDVNKEVNKRYKGIMMIAEETTSLEGVTKPTEQGGLGFGFTWNVGWMNDLLSFMASSPMFRPYEQQKITFSLMYAFKSNFVLPFSHDEVVKGRKSLLFKMDGDMWQKFANLRLIYGYLFTHPGKKLLFMGNEFAQKDEWCVHEELDWGLLNEQPHAKMQQFIKDLNDLYKREKSLWEIDDSYDGFEWVDCNNNVDTIFSFIRKARDVKDQLIVVINFMPQVKHDFRVGVPYPGAYEEVINSDATRYDGSGVVNSMCQAEPIPWNNLRASIRISVPPLGIAVFKWKNT